MGVPWYREREHTINDPETRGPGCWASSTRWRIYCNKRESQRLGFTGKQWHRGLLTVRDSWFRWRDTGSRGIGRAQMRATSKNCSGIFWRSQNPSCCDWGWLCGTQNSLRSRAKWGLGPLAPSDGGRGQGTPRQQDLEPGETTHRRMSYRANGPTSEIGTQWSSRQIQSTLFWRASNKRKDWTTLRLGRLPVSQRCSRFYFLQLSARQGHVMLLFDVTAAFLQSPMEEVYLEQPHEFVKEG